MSPIAIYPASYYHCDVVLIMTSFAAPLATPSVTDVRMYVRTDTLPRLIYKDVAFVRFRTALYYPTNTPALYLKN